MEVKEYVSHFRGLRDDSFQTHRLTHKQVVDNESRKRIIETIFNDPGIHYNLIRKRCNLQPGQFRWHIDVLLNYKIVRREKHGQNVVFFPTIGEYDQDFDMILKFPLRDSIYQIIGSNPGIILSDIARELNIPNQRNKVKYHVDKLISANLITVVQKGRKRELFKKSK
jgi:predicted transcriptional regulator